MKASGNRYLAARCDFRRAVGVNDPDRLDFARLYAQVASIQDYAFVYRGEEIMTGLWSGNAPHFIETARDRSDGHMLGFVCCHPMASEAEPRISRWIKGHTFPFSDEKAVMISALGVRQDARQGGLSASLGYDALAWARSEGYEWFVLQARNEIVRKKEGLAERLGLTAVAKLVGGNVDTGPIVLHWGNVQFALGCDECNH